MGRRAGQDRPAHLSGGAATRPWRRRPRMRRARQRKAATWRAMTGSTAANYQLGAADRHPARAGPAARGAGEVGPGADRQRQDASSSYTKIVAPLSGRTGTAARGRRQHPPHQSTPPASSSSPSSADRRRCSRCRSSNSASWQIAQGGASGLPPAATDRRQIDPDSAAGPRQPDRPTTGTVRLKAAFPNARDPAVARAVRRRAVHVDTLRQVVVVPPPAVQRGPRGAYVYVAARGAMPRSGR